MTGAAAWAPDPFERAGGHACRRPAPDGPGAEPRWSSSAKSAVGTAYSASSRVWFTLAGGAVTEVYYPTIDRPQVKDLRFVVTDGDRVVAIGGPDAPAEVEALREGALGFRVTAADVRGRFRIQTEVVCDPHQPVLLLRTRLRGATKDAGPLRLFALLAPHLSGGGAGNTGYAVDVAGLRALVAEKGGFWLAFGATPGFVHGSAGFAGVNDGATDLARDGRMDWSFDCAHDGNVVLTAEFDLAAGEEHVAAVAFGDTYHGATAALLQALAMPFDVQRDRFLEQWARAESSLLPLGDSSGDGGALYRHSHGVLLAHEDKTYAGALIASLSIPWGEDKGDDALGGYHLVWTRDLVQAATGLLAAGNRATPLRTLVYLAASQRPDGGFAQNFWIDGEPYWSGIQLDEIAFPILLARHLHRLGASGEFDSEFDAYPLVLRAAKFLVRAGPATGQDRWEEAAGYSPSTLAVTIAALTCAAATAREHGDEGLGAFFEAHADWIESRVDGWTVTTRGSVLKGVPRHYVRILPVDLADPDAPEDLDAAVLRIANRAPGERAAFPARDVVDAGFLELVRYGVRAADDPLIVDSLRVVDAALRVETPFGPSWRRYSHDGYGEPADGSPYRAHGIGRAWPLLTGERAHYETAAGRDALPLVRAMEGFAAGAGLLPEQVWDDGASARGGRAAGRSPGRPTGGAMPLVWAHAEYVKLLRSRADGRVFDLVPEVAARYATAGPRRRPAAREVWKPERHARSVRAGTSLRVMAYAPFALRVTLDEWRTMRDVPATSPGLETWVVDVDLPPSQRAPVRFTMRWADGTWEGRDHEVAVEAPA